MINFRFAYLFGTLIFGLIWLLIFVKRKDLRKEQLYMGTLIGLAGFTEPLFYGSYWSPQFFISLPNINIGIESILLCFFYGGIASTLYEFIFNEILKKTSRESKKERKLETLLSIFIGITVSLFCWSIFKINFIYATIYGMLSVGFTLIFFRKDLFTSCLINGIIMAILSFIVLYIFGQVFSGIFNLWWRLDLLSGLRIFEVPFEEIMWHFALGFAAGPMYEVWKGYSDYKISRGSGT